MLINLVSSDGQPIILEYLKKVYHESKMKEFDSATLSLLEELKDMSSQIQIRKTIDESNKIHWSTYFDHIW